MWTRRQLEKGLGPGKFSLAAAPQVGGRGPDQVTFRWGRELPFLWLFSLWLQDPSRAAQALGGGGEHMEVREEEQGIDQGRGRGSKFQDHKEEGYIIFMCSDGRGWRNTPTPTPAFWFPNIRKAFEFIQLHLRCFLKFTTDPICRKR